MNSSSTVYRRPVVWTAAVLVLGAVGAAVGTPDPDIAALERDPVAELRLGLTEWLEARSFATAEWGVLAVSLDSGDTLVALDAARPLAPASNLKLLTTAVALHHLGPDFRWQTLLVSEAPIVDGVLTGDLVVYGTGDPGLAERLHDSEDEPFRQLAEQLAERGVRRVAGRLLGDGTFFEGPVRLPQWDAADLNDWFAAASPALGYAENVVQFRIEAARPGQAPIVHLDPGHGGMRVRNEARTSAGRARRPLWLEREDPLEPVRVTGEIAQTGGDVYRTMTVQDPVVWAAHAMEAALDERGITVEGGVGRVASAAASPLTPRGIFATGRATEATGRATEATGPAGAATASAQAPGAVPRVLASFRSPPLSAALEVVNQRSHNLYADMILKTVGRVVLGDGSFSGGARVAEQFAVHELGIAPAEVRVLDGSGLADGNRLSARALVRTVEWATSSAHANVFEASLPAAGTRQLNRRMRRTAAADNLRAKTGTIAGVSALSGIVRTRDGEQIAFSIVGNGLRSPWAAKRSVEDEFGVALAELGGRGGTASASDSGQRRADRDR